MYPDTPVEVAQRPAAFPEVESRRSYFGAPGAFPQRTAKDRNHGSFGEATSREDEAIWPQREARYDFPGHYDFNRSASSRSRGSPCGSQRRSPSLSSPVRFSADYDLEEVARDFKRDSAPGSPRQPEDEMSVAGGVSIQESYSNSQLAPHTSITGLPDHTAAESSPTLVNISRSEAQISTSGPQLKKPLGEAGSASTDTPQSVDQDRHQAPELASTPAKLPATNAEPPPPPQLSYSQAIQKPRGQPTRGATMPRGPTPSTPTHPEFLTAKGAQKSLSLEAHRQQISQKPNQAHRHRSNKDLTLGAIKITFGSTTCYFQKVQQATCSLIAPY